MINRPVLLVGLLKQSEQLLVFRRISLHKCSPGLLSDLATQLGVQVTKNNIGSILSGQSNKPLPNATCAA